MSWNLKSSKSEATTTVQYQQKALNILASQGKEVYCSSELFFRGAEEYDVNCFLGLGVWMLVL